MQNDFVVRVKKAVKKIAAFAGAAIIASSAISPALASTLADLPSPFVNTNGQFDANVVVGSQTWNALVAGDPAGVASDLAGAIDVAAAFAQRATAAAGTTGTVALTRDVAPGVLMNSSGNGRIAVGGSSTTNTFNASVAGFEWLVNTTYVFNSTDYPIYEKLTAGPVANIDHTGTFNAYNAFVYNITSNGTAVPPATYDKWPMFGALYSLLSASPTQLRFGQLTSVTNVPFGTDVAVGTKATVRITDWDTASSKAKVVITAADGSTYINDYYPEGTTFDNTTLGFTVTLKDIVISSILGNHIDIDWSTTSVTLSNVSGLNNASALVGKTSPFANWTVNYQSPGNNLTWLSFTSPVSGPGSIALTPGQSVIGTYFNITFEGWSTNNYTTIQAVNFNAGSGAEITYQNNASSPATKGINLDGISGDWNNVGSPTYVYAVANKSTVLTLLTSDDQFQFQWLNGSTPMITTGSEGQIQDAIGVYNTAGTNIWNLTATNTTAFGIGNFGQGAPTWAYAIFNTSGAWYNISYTNLSFNISLLNWSSADSGQSYTGQHDLYGQYFTNNLLWTTTDVDEFNKNGTISGTLVLTEPDAKTVTITYAQDAVSSTKANSIGGSGTVAVGTTMYTSYGTTLAPAASSVLLTYPESIRTANIWIGRSASTATTFSVGDTITGTTYVVSSVGAGGSPAINPITPGIGVVDTAVVFTSITKPTILVGGSSVNKGVYDLGSAGVPAANVTANRAYIQLVQNAYSTTKTVLVIAGRDAKDTRLACQLLAAKIAGTSTVSLTGSLVWLDTSGSTYSTVTVVPQ